MKSSLTSKRHLNTKEMGCGFDSVLQENPKDTFQGELNRYLEPGIDRGLRMCQPPVMMIDRSTCG